MILSFVRIVSLLATCTVGLTRGSTDQLLFITRHDISLVELSRPTDLLSRRRSTTVSNVDANQSLIVSDDPITLGPTPVSATKYNVTNSTLDQPPPLQNRVIVANLDDASAVDFLWSDSSLYWTDATRGRLYQAFVNDTSRLPASGSFGIPKTIQSRSLRPGAVISVGLVSPDGVACDWVGRKLYWADSDTDRIEVSQLDGKSRKVLYWRGVDQPRSIALDPRHGHMFWADWGETPKLERAGMDGDETTRSVLVSGGDIVWPNSLTIDHDVGRIYWVDEHLKLIQSVRLDGSDRRLFYKSSGTGAALPSSSLQPGGIALVGDLIYWTDWHTMAVYAANKHGDEVSKEDGEAYTYRVVATSIRVQTYIRAYGSQSQPESANACGVGNGGCSHLCLLSPTSPFYKCACPTGIKLQANNKTCAEVPEEMLLLARRPDLRRISLDTPDYTDVVLDIRGIQNAVAVDYDPVDRMVYWTDDRVRAVRRARLDGTGAEFVVNVGLDQPDGIAVDWVSRNLYWTDKGTDRIEMSRLNGMGRHVVISEGLREPRAIALDPFGGRIYWSDWGEPAKIESAALDGTDRIVLVNTSIRWPNGLAIDRSEGRLYWGDANMDRIEMIFLNGTGRRILLSELPHVFGFALLGDYVYWTDWHRRTVERSHKLTGKQRMIIIDQLPEVMGLTAVNTSMPHGVNGCSGNNGNCSHLCIHRPDGQMPRCLCPKDMELDADGKRCLTPEALLIYARQSDLRRISLGTDTDVVIDENDILVNTGVEEACAVDCHVSESRIYWTDIKTKEGDAMQLQLWTIRPPASSLVPSDSVTGSPVKTPATLRNRVVTSGECALSSPQRLLAQPTISSVYINGSGIKRVIKFGLSQPEGIAVDWIANNLYWTDFGTERIEMSRLDGSSRLVIVSKDMRPKAIAVDPMAGYIYWSNAISSGPRLERATLDGMNRRTIVTDVGQVSSMAIDYDRHRLYWVSADRGFVEMSDMLGGSRRLLVNGLPPLYGVTVHGDHVYWSDWATRSLEKADKLSGAGRSVIRSRMDYPMDLATFHVSRQQGWNACAANNGGCAHLCIANVQSADSVSTSYHCACATHYTLAADNRTCQAPSAFILISQKSVISRLSLSDVTDSNRKDVDVTLPLRSFRNVQAVAYDINTDFIYWIDARNKSIRKARDDGSQVSTVRLISAYSDVNIQPYDLAIYSVTGGESILYFTDVANNCIRSVDLGSNVGRVVLRDNEQKPRFIAVEPIEGLLFWMGVDGSIKSIERSSLDGGSRRTLFSGIRSLGPIAVDSTSRRVFWIDRDAIQSGSIDGGSSKPDVIVRQVSDAIAIAVAGPYVYWADHVSKSVQRANKMTGADLSYVRTRLEDLRELIAIRSGSQPLSVNSSPCLRAGCSHSCSTEADGSTLCSCPAGLVLGSNQQTCVVDQSRKSTPRCRDGEYACAVGSSVTCLNAMRTRCNGKSDCDDKSDEVNCTSTCRSRQFSCRTMNQCVPVIVRCDGRPDCLDGSDEDGCMRCGDSDSYACEVDGLCIARERVCDGRSDCSDSQDELNCPLGLSAYNAPTWGSNRTLIIVGSSCGFMLVVICFVVYFSWRYSGQLACCRTGDKKLSSSSSWLSSSSSSSSKLRQKPTSVTLTQSLVAASRSNGSNESEPCRSPQHLCYDRAIVTTSLSSDAGASASGSRYPRETLNPPPSPITTDCSVPSALHRGRTAWRSRASATMSPCSTDVCGDDDGGYSESSWNDNNGGVMMSATEFGYETDPLYPPPPTPCSRYVSTDIDATAHCSRYMVGDDPALCCYVSTATSVSSTDHGCHGHRGSHHKHSVTRAASLSSMAS